MLLASRIAVARKPGPSPTAAASGHVASAHRRARRLHPERPRHRHRAEKDEHEQVRDAEIRERLRPRRVEPAARQRERAHRHDGPAAAPHQVRAHEDREHERQDRRALRLLRPDEPRLRHPQRPDALGRVGALQEVVVVVRVVRPDLDEQRARAARTRPRAARTRRPPPRAPRPRARARRRRAASSAAPRAARPSSAEGRLILALEMLRSRVTGGSRRRRSWACAFRCRPACPPGPPRSCRRAWWRGRPVPGARRRRPRRRWRRP